MRNGTNAAGTPASRSRAAARAVGPRGRHRARRAAARGCLRPRVGDPVVRTHVVDAGQVRHARATSERAGRVVLVQRPGQGRRSPRTSKRVRALDEPRGRPGQRRSEHRTEAQDGARRGRDASSANALTISSASALWPEYGRSRAGRTAETLGQREVVVRVRAVDHRARREHDLPDAGVAPPLPATSARPADVDVAHLGVVIARPRTRDARATSHPASDAGEVRRPDVHPVELEVARRRLPARRCRSRRRV